MVFQIKVILKVLFQSKVAWKPKNQNQNISLKSEWQEIENSSSNSVW